MSGVSWCLAVVLAASAAYDVPDHDRVVERVQVPSADKRHGEVRVVRRGELTVVQTVLYSKVLRRVAGEIAKKESRNWPAGAQGAEDARLYVNALRRVVDGVRDGQSEGEDRRRALRIDFVAHPEGARVVVSGADVEDREGRLELRATRPPEERLELSGEYVERNMRLIVADAFGIPLEEAEAMLLRAGRP